MTNDMNTKFLARAVIVLLALTVVILVAASFYAEEIVSAVFPGAVVDIPLGAPPPPPTILAPRGALPAGPGGLKEWTRYGNGDYGLAGSGFLLRLYDGRIIGVTTAHSVEALGQPGSQLNHIAFSRPDQPRPFVVECDTLYGQPGVARRGDDLTVDYVLLHVNGPLDTSLALAPDPRGAPQPGERVTLFGGVGDLNGGRRLFSGVVVVSDDKGAWAQMDEDFEPAMLSGSPFVSEHTGLVVGMTLSFTRREGRLFIGLHPIGHLVEMAEAAREFPKIGEYQR